MTLTRLTHEQLAELRMLVSGSERRAWRARIYAPLWLAAEADALHRRYLEILSRIDSRIKETTCDT